MSTPRKRTKTELNTLEQESIVQEARKDIKLFFLLIFGDIMDLQPFSNELLQLVQKFTDENKKGLIIAASPRSGKTITISQLYAA